MYQKLHPLVKTTLGILIGVIVGFCVIVLAEGINAKLYPSSLINPTMEEFIAEIKTLPQSAFYLILCGYILSSFFGSYTAARLSSYNHKLMAAMTVGFVLLLGGLVQFISIPHPLWLSISSCISFIVFSFVGGKLAK